MPKIRLRVVCGSVTVRVPVSPDVTVATFSDEVAERLAEYMTLWTSVVPKLTLFHNGDLLCGRDSISDLGLSDGDVLEAIQAPAAAPAALPTAPSQAAPSPAAAPPTALPTAPPQTAPAPALASEPSAPAFSFGASPPPAPAPAPSPFAFSFGGGASPPAPAAPFGTQALPRPPSFSFDAADATMALSATASTDSVLTVLVVSEPGGEPVPVTVADKDASLATLKSAIAEKHGTTDYVADLPVTEIGGEDVATTALVRVCLAAGTPPVDMRLPKSADVRELKAQVVPPIDVMVRGGTVLSGWVELLDADELVCFGKHAHDVANLDTWQVTVELDGAPLSGACSVEISNYLLPHEGEREQTVAEITMVALGRLVGDGTGITIALHDKDRLLVDSLTLKEAKIVCGTVLTARCLTKSSAEDADRPLTHEESIYNVTVYGDGLATVAVKLGLASTLADLRAAVDDERAAQGVFSRGDGPTLAPGIPLLAQRVKDGASLKLAPPPNRPRLRCIPACPPRVAIDLASAQGGLHSTGATDAHSLELWGITDKCTLYAVRRRTTCPVSSADLAIFEDRSPGKMDNFAAKGWLAACSLLAASRRTEPAESAESGSASAAQAPATIEQDGLCVFLSTLCVFVQQPAPARLRNVSALRGMLYDYPPACAALNACMNSTALLASERAAFIVAVRFLLRKILPEVDDLDLLAQARVLFAVILKRADSVTDAHMNCETHRTVDLRCKISDLRLVDPVMTEEGLIVERERSSEMGLAVNEETRRALLRNPHTQTPSAWTGEVDWAKLAAEGEVAVPVLTYSVLSLERVLRGCAVLAVVPPARLKKIAKPAITVDDTGHHSVHTGLGKGTRDLVIYSPHTDKDGMHSVESLVRAHAALGIVIGAGESWEVERKPDESIVVCLDISRSMASAANFDADEDDKSESGSSDHGDDEWRWNDGDDAESTASDLSVDGDGESSTPPSPRAGGEAGEEDTVDGEVDMTLRAAVDSQAAARAARLHSEYMAEWQRLKAMESFSEICDLARRTRNDQVLEELCILNEPKEPKGSEMYQLFSRHRAQLLLDLLAEDGSNEEDDSDGIPHAFIDPISREMFRDPVCAPDGHSYSRSTIMQWLDNHNTSPMTGAELAGGSLVENHSLKAQISDWLDRGRAAGGDDADQSAAAAGAGGEEVLPPPAPVTVTVRWAGQANIEIDLCQGVAVDTVLRRIASLSRSVPNYLVLRGRRLYSGRALPPFAAGDTIQAVSVPSESLTVEVSVKVHCSSVRRGKKLYLVTHPGASVADLSLRIWRAHEDLHPSSFTLWAGLKDVGDGHQVGYTLEPGQSKLRTYMRHRNEDGHLALELRHRHKPAKGRSGPVPISRMAAAQAVITAFANRSDAYELSHHIGLVLFGSEVSTPCVLTSHYEQFKDHIDEAEPTGDTALYDAIVKATDMLKEEKAKHPDTILRILCLSDGCDTTSGNSEDDAAAVLESAGVVLDSLHIGRADEGISLCMMAHETGGYAFHPRTLKQCLRLCEDETCLSLRERGDDSCARAADDEYDIASATLRRPVPKLEKPARSLETAVNAEFSPARVDAPPATVRAVTRELREVFKNPHPMIDVFPLVEDMMFWKLVIQGPESTPYAAGCWLAHLVFPADYPASAPTVRFDTKIAHCNINSHGRVCHSIFDRNWQPGTSVRTVLDLVFGLLLSPDVDDPLDSDMALTFYNSDGQYEAQIIEAIKHHASDPRSALVAGIEAEDLLPAERVGKSTETLQTVVDMFKGGPPLAASGVSLRPPVGMVLDPMARELSQVSLAWLPIDPPLSPLLAPETATHYFVARGRAAIVLAQLQDHEAGDPSEMLRWASAAQAATESARGSGFLEAPQELSQGLSLLQSQAVLYYALGQHRVGSEDRALRELKAAFDGLPKHEDWAKAMRKTIRKVYDAAKALKKARRDAENVAYRRMFS